MSWKEELIDLRKTTYESDARRIAESIFEEMQLSVINGYFGKVFSFHISPEVGDILVAEGLEYETYKETETHDNSMLFEESKVWFTK
jgi:hypothetical protein